VALLVETGVTSELRSVALCPSSLSFCLPACLPFCLSACLPRRSSHTFRSHILARHQIHHPPSPDADREQLLASARESFAGRAADWVRDGGVAAYMTRVEVRRRARPIAVGRGLACA